MSHTHAGKWLSKAAVLWALYEAPDVPARLVSTLIVIASFAGADGKGAHPSVSAVALLTRKSERQVRCDIAKLVELKLLVPGDQRAVARIRADRRPVVYDLPMPRGAPDCTPSDDHGVQRGSQRGAIHRQNGVQPIAPEEVLKTSGTVRARARAEGADASAPQPCDRDGTRPHSEACRKGQGTRCGYEWCMCACHGRAA